MASRRFIVRVQPVRHRPELVVVLAILAAPVLNAIELKPETLQAWDAYVHDVKSRMDERASGQSSCLGGDERAERRQRVRNGEVVVEPSNGASPHPVQRGMIH